MGAKVIPLFEPPPDVPLTYTTVLRSIAEAIEQKCGLDHADQLVTFGSFMSVVINIETGKIDFEYDRRPVE